MKPRSRLSKKEREASSRLAQLVREEGLLRGNLVVMSRRCGKKGCHCVRGEKHVSLYLAQSRNGQMKMSYVPKSWETKVKEWVKRYQKIKTLLEQLSQTNWEKLRKRKE